MNTDRTLHIQRDVISLRSSWFPDFIRVQIDEHHQHGPQVLSLTHQAIL
jgi:hypothetical protein